MLVVFVDSFKGGVGKTTTARWLARSLVANGHRVLLTGLSVQNDAYPGVPIGVPGLREALLGRATKSLELEAGLWVWPAGAAEPDLGYQGRLEQVLETRGAELGADYALIDGVNFLSSLSWAAVAAADCIVVPANPRPEPVVSALKTLGAIRRSAAGRPVLAKMLLTQVPSPSARSRGEAGVLGAVRLDYPDQTFGSEIRLSRRYEAFGAVSTDASVAVPGLRGNLLAADYAALVREIKALSSASSGVAA